MHVCRMYTHPFHPASAALGPCQKEARWYLFVSPPTHRGDWHAHARMRSLVLLMTLYENQELMSRTFKQDSHVV